MTKSPFQSRKFIISILVSILSIIVPILYCKLGISEGVTLTVLGIMGGVSSFYLGINVLNKKVVGDKVE